MASTAGDMPGVVIDSILPMWEPPKWMDKPIVYTGKLDPGYAPQNAALGSGEALHFVEGPNGAIYAAPLNADGTPAPLEFKTLYAPDPYAVLAGNPWKTTMTVGKPVKNARFEPRFPLNVSRAELLAFIRGLAWSVTCPPGELKSYIANEDVRKFLVRQNEPTPGLVPTELEIAQMAEEEGATEAEVAKLFEEAATAEVIAQAADKAQQMMEDVHVGADVAMKGIGVPMQMAAGDAPIDYSSVIVWNSSDTIQWMAPEQLHKLDF